MHQIISLNDFPWSFKDWVSDHSDMSPEYLEETFSSFANPAGNSLILNGTSAAETVSIRPSFWLFSDVRYRDLMCEELKMSFSLEYVQMFLKPSSMVGMVGATVMGLHFFLS